MIRTVWQDLVFGLRILRSNPGFTAVAVLTLALGIAANATVFSWIDMILLRPLPGVAEGERLAVLETFLPNGEFILNSYPDYCDYRDSLKLVSGLAAWRSDPLSIGEGEQARQVWGQLVSGNFFAVLGVKLVVGRAFVPGDGVDRPGGSPVAVLSHRLWRSAFQGDPRVAGKTVRVNRQQFTIVGVAPPEFRGAQAGGIYDIWVPLRAAPALNGSPEAIFQNRRTRHINLLARLKPGVSLDQARAEAAATAGRLAAAYAKDNLGNRAVLAPVGKAHDGSQERLREPLLILMAVCGLVLLIGCANLANLLLARATARHKEFGIRLALGAGRGRLARQLFSETLLLAGAGAIGALLLAMWIPQAVVWLVASEATETAALRINGRLLAFTLGVGVLAALAAGLAPALLALRPNLSETLKQGGRSGGSGAGAHRARGLLVVAEVALASVALVAAGLFIRSFRAACAIHPGFDPNNLLVSRVLLTNSGPALDEQNNQFAIRLTERLAARPGITGVSYADTAPLGVGRGPWKYVQVEGYVPAPNESMAVNRSLVSPGFFHVMQVRLLEGREFTGRDQAKSQPVMIVNEAFARRYFGGASPVGRRVFAWDKWHTVVGLAKDVKHFRPTEAPLPYFYVPFAQQRAAGQSVAFFVRTGGDPRRAIATLRREAAAADPNNAVYEAVPMTEYIWRSVIEQKFAATLLSLLGALAVALAALGLYSVMAYAVSQRTQEMGIRMALGARPGNVLGMILRQAMGLTAAGLAAGIAAALAATRLIAGMLVKVSPGDPATFAAAALALGAIAALASYVPARRATKVDPMSALNCQ